MGSNLPKLGFTAFFFFELKLYFFPSAFIIQPRSYPAIFINTQNRAPIQKVKKMVFSYFFTILKIEPELS